MDVLPEFELLKPTTVAELGALARARPASRLLGGGTDLLVNLRRGIGDPPALIDVNGVAELKEIAVGPAGLGVGAGVRIADLAADAEVQAGYPVIAQAAASIAGPTHRMMGTVGGNLCLDTRCLFYNQSEWWRVSNDYCLKHRGTKCHVAPKSEVCFATFSGDLAPAFLVLGGRVEIVGPDGSREIDLADLYTGNGQHYLTLAPGEFVTAVRAPAPPAGLVSAYDKVRVRRSIDYPLAGVAVALRKQGETLADLRVAITGTNPRPVRIEGLEALLGRPLDDAFAAEFEDLVLNQVMAMKTTFTPGTYRRRVSHALAARLVRGLAA